MYNSTNYIPKTKYSAKLAKRYSVKLGLGLAVSRETLTVTEVSKQHQLNEFLLTKGGEVCSI